VIMGRASSATPAEAVAPSILRLLNLSIFTTTSLLSSFDPFRCRLR
jgi:hypothetical protein